MCGLLRRTSRILDPVELAFELPREDDRAFFAPCPPAVAPHVSKRDCRPASHRFLLQFPVAEKSDPLTIRRKEGRESGPGPFEQYGRTLVQFPNVELNLS